MKNTKLSLFAISLIVLSISLSVSVPVTIRQEVDDEPQPSFEPIDLFPDLPQTKLGTSFMINTGGDSVGSYARDSYQLVSGTTGSFHALPTTVVDSGETPAKVYLSHRYGLHGSMFSYNLPLSQAGTYECTLHFAETFMEYQVIGGRVFSVYASGNGGEELAADIDVFAESGENPAVPVYRKFTITATDTIKFTFVASAAEAMISGIACNLIS